MKNKKETNDKIEPVTMEDLTQLGLVTLMVSMGVEPEEALVKTGIAKKEELEEVMEWTFDVIKSLIKRAVHETIQDMKNELEEESISGEVQEGAKA